MSLRTVQLTVDGSKVESITNTSLKVRTVAIKGQGSALVVMYVFLDVELQIACASDR